jgi:hypothetical protein
MSAVVPLRILPVTERFPGELYCPLLCRVHSPQEIQGIPDRCRGSHSTRAASRPDASNPQTDPAITYPATFSLSLSISFSYSHFQFHFLTLTLSHFLHDLSCRFALQSAFPPRNSRNTKSVPSSTFKTSCQSDRPRSRRPTHSSRALQHLVRRQSSRECHFGCAWGLRLGGAFFAQQRSVLSVRVHACACQISIKSAPNLHQAARSRPPAGWPGF